jgi:diguanylate cyclase (GGDEF)-like protein
LIALVAKTLVFAGALVLLGSLFTTCRLITRLGKGRLRNHWYAMVGMVVFFLLGYLGYTWAFWNRQSELLDLIVPVVFFCGACFVWLSASLSLQTAVAVMRVGLLEQENIIDPLTAVYNRRYLDRRLGEEFMRARRHGLPLSILLFDIDHFKQINDTHGHQAGDRALALFARHVAKHLREPDVLARYGGDEFMVIAPHTDHDGALVLALRMRESLASAPFSLDDDRKGQHQVRLSSSIGVASLGSEVERPEALVQLADENLYRAKRDGRNRVNADRPVTATPSAPA